MSGYQDFEAVKREISIEMAAHMLGLDLKQSGTGQFRSSCPACPNAGNRALVVTPAKGFYCWGVKKGGDQIALVAHVRQVSMKDAASFLAGTRTVPESEGAKDNGARTQHAQSFQPLAYLEADNEAVVAIGFSAEFAKKHGIGYAGKGVMRGSVAIPMRDENGILLGYIATQELTYIAPDFTPNVVSLERRRA